MNKITPFKIFFIICFLTFSLSNSGQIVSGVYDLGLNISYNPKNKVITGYFESYTGFDERTGNPRFSCIFYIQGLYDDSVNRIVTYYPIWKDQDEIVGKIWIKDSTKISIMLPKEHGGCWNVWHFADGYSDFDLSEKKGWIEIRHINTDKSYFYSEKDERTKQKSYIVKGDIIYIDNIEDTWVHCEYKGKTTTRGWIKLETINK
jgi:hypothetical protein